MRRRYQKPRITDKGGYWIAQYRDVAGVKEAEERRAKILEPINATLAAPRRGWTFGNFVDGRVKSGADRLSPDARV